MILGINASRARSGGARAHLIGILGDGDPPAHGFQEVHVWAYPELCAALPKRPWLVCHAPRALSAPRPVQALWERFGLARAFATTRCDLLFNVDAGSVSTVAPAVTMSQDLLSYEPGEMARYPWWRPLRMRVWTLRYIQNWALRRAQGAIFLTHYAGALVQNYCGPLADVAYIPHGISDTFKKVADRPRAPLRRDGAIECLYVSPVWAFKHQWVVVRAVDRLRRMGRDVRLTLVGGGDAIDLARLKAEIARTDPASTFVKRLGHVASAELPALIAASDIYVFASSCENMPVTLLEGMAAGVPIASSDRGPMPEVLENGGVYFDPEDEITIATAIEQLIADPALCARVSARAQTLANGYSWQRCADETFAYLARVAARHHGARR